MKKFKRIVKTRLWHIVSTACLLLCLNTIVATGTSPYAQPDGFSWYFTFQSLNDGSIHAPFSVQPKRTPDGYVGFQVVQVIQLWSAGHVMSEQSIVLDCTVSEDIDYVGTNNDWSLYLHNDSSISCQSVDLRMAVLTLSKGTLDPCPRTSQCEIPVSDVFVEAEVGTDSDTVVPIFRYESLLFSASEDEMELKKGQNYSTSSSIALSYSDPSHLRIAQEGQFVNHYMGGVLQKADPAPPAPFSFNSSPQMIYFGYDPSIGVSPGDLIIGNGIFDPYSGGYYFP